MGRAAQRVVHRVAQRLRHADGEAYNGFNMLVADARQAFVATNPGASVQLDGLDAGVHVLTNLALNDPTCPRIAKSSQLFRAVRVPGASELDSVVAELRAILSDHATALDPRAAVIDTLCVHLPGYGTRSSSIVAITAAGCMRYWHAAGPPCRTPYEELTLR